MKETFNFEFAGQVGMQPSFPRIFTSDSLATITTTGWIDNKQTPRPLTTTDVVQIMYAFNEDTQTGIYQEFTVAVNDGVTTLTEYVNPANIDLPTAANRLAYFTDTAGTLSAADNADIMHIGTILAYKDNATSFRLRGPSSPNDPSAGAIVQTYSGIFYNDSYSNFGVLKTRASYGANVEMDLAIQSPRALLLIAQDGSQTDGVIKCASQTQVQFHTRYSAEQEGISYSYFDRTSTASTGDSNTSAVTLNTNSNHLYFQYGATTQAVVLPTIASGSLSGAVAGTLFYDTGTNKLMFYNGSGLETVTSS